jgi:hypothetical protein
VSVGIPRQFSWVVSLLPRTDVQDYFTTDAKRIGNIRCTLLVEHLIKEGKISRWWTIWNNAIRQGNIRRLHASPIMTEKSCYGFRTPSKSVMMKDTVCIALGINWMALWHENDIERMLATRLSSNITWDWLLCAVLPRLWSGTSLKFQKMQNEQNEEGTNRAHLEPTLSRNLHLCQHR